MADILLAAELENEMEVMAEGEDGDEEVFADDGEEVDGEGYVDRSHLVGKPKRKRELKAGLLRWEKSPKNIFFTFFLQGAPFQQAKASHLQWTVHVMQFEKLSPTKLEFIVVNEKILINLRKC